jgi:hypothetical protein
MIATAISSPRWILSTPIGSPGSNPVFPVVGVVICLLDSVVSTVAKDPYVRNPFRRTAAPSEHAKGDGGSGDWRNYRFDLVPVNRRVVIELAGSNPYQDELAAMVGVEKLECFIARRTTEEERVDAPMPVRLFLERRMSGVVGLVPRGLEPVVVEAIARLEAKGESGRIPASLHKTRAGLRLRLLMGETR